MVCCRAASHQCLMRVWGWPSLGLFYPSFSLLMFPGLNRETHTGGSWSELTPAFALRDAPACDCFYAAGVSPAHISLPILLFGWGEGSYFFWSRRYILHRSLPWSTHGLLVWYQKALMEHLPFYTRLVVLI